MAVALTARFLEYIHDEMVGSLLPFDEAVSKSEYRNHQLLESAAGRPFHSAGGEDVWPTLSQKAAALFHSLACNHCFMNGCDLKVVPMIVRRGHAVGPAVPSAVP